MQKNKKEYEEVFSSDFNEDYNELDSAESSSSEDLDRMEEVSRDFWVKKERSKLTKTSKGKKKLSKVSKKEAVGVGKDATSEHAQKKMSFEEITLLVFKTMNTKGRKKTNMSNNLKTLISLRNNCEEFAVKLIPTASVFEILSKEVEKDTTRNNFESALSELSEFLEELAPNYDEKIASMNRTRKNFEAKVNKEVPFEQTDLKENQKACNFALLKTTEKSLSQSVISLFSAISKKINENLKINSTIEDEMEAIKKEMKFLNLLKKAKAIFSLSQNLNEQMVQISSLLLSHLYFKETGFEAETNEMKSTSEIVFESDGFRSNAPKDLALYVIQNGDIMIQKLMASIQMAIHFAKNGQPRVGEDILSTVTEKARDHESCQKLFNIAVVHVGEGYFKEGFLSDTRRVLAPVWPRCKEDFNLAGKEIPRRVTIHSESLDFALCFSTIFEFVENKIMGNPQNMENTSDFAFLEDIILLGEKGRICAKQSVLKERVFRFFKSLLRGNPKDCEFQLLRIYKGSEAISKLFNKKSTGRIIQRMKETLSKVYFNRFHRGIKGEKEQVAGFLAERFSIGVESMRKVIEEREKEGDFGMSQFGLGNEDNLQNVVV